MAKYYLYCIALANRPNKFLARVVYGPFDTEADVLEVKNRSEHSDQYTIEELPCETLEEAIDHYSRVDSSDQSVVTEVRPFSSLEEVLKFDSLGEMFSPAPQKEPWYKRWFRPKR